MKVVEGEAVRVVEGEESRTVEVCLVQHVRLVTRGVEIELREAKLVSGVELVRSINVVPEKGAVRIVEGVSVVKFEGACCSQRTVRLVEIVRGPVEVVRLVEVVTALAVYCSQLVVMEIYYPYSQGT